MTDPEQAEHIPLPGNPHPGCYVCGGREPGPMPPVSDGPGRWRHPWCTPRSATPPPYAAGADLDPPTGWPD